MAKTKPTELTTHAGVTPSWEKARPLKIRKRPPPIQHLRRKQDKAIPSSRHLRKDIIEMKPRQDKTLQRAPKTKENYPRAPSADREERIKLLLHNL